MSLSEKKEHVFEILNLSPENSRNCFLSNVIVCSLFPFVFPFWRWAYPGKNQKDYSPLSSLHNKNSSLGASNSQVLLGEEYLQTEQSKQSTLSSTYPPSLEKGWSTNYENPVRATQLHGNSLQDVCVVSYLMQQGGEEGISGNCSTLGLGSALRELFSAISLSLLKWQPSHQHYEEAHFSQAKKAENQYFLEVKCHLQSHHYQGYLFPSTVKKRFCTLLLSLLNSHSPQISSCV